MKRILLFVLVFLVLCIAAVYILVPKQLAVESAVTVHANREGVYRFLASDSNWKKWWPGTIKKTSANSLCFTHDGYDFQLGQKLYNAIQLNVSKNGDSSAGLIRLIPFTNDSMRVELFSQLDARPNPFSR